MISTTGMPTTSALKLIDRTEDRQIEQIRKSPEHARAISIFRERMRDVETVDDLMKDRDLYVFVMRAFDLEDQIFGKGLIKKALESDINDKTSLISRLTDPRIKELYKTLDFREGGKLNFNTLSSRWREEMVDRYLERQFINSHKESNAPVGEILEFRKKAPGINSWYDVFKDKPLYAFMRTALGVPESVVKLDIDKAADWFERKFPLEGFKDPKQLAKLERQYSALSDTANGVGGAPGSGALQLLSMMRSSPGQARIVTIDVALISSVPRFPYR
ncbi:MAG: DUF1217 domain-containing protein [Myxococcales bacterium]|jgi:hypothetical protein|nr:DUF1217 domain-containing protein [Myxococcales bacterium]